MSVEWGTLSGLVVLIVLLYIIIETIDKKTESDVDKVLEESKKVREYPWLHRNGTTTKT